MSKIIEPKFAEKKFTCPFCKLFTHQNWHWVITAIKYKDDTYKPAHELNFMASMCSECKNTIIWNKETKDIVYPIYLKLDSFLSQIPEPNSDMDKDIQKTYLEARQIAKESPRGASALLRLCIEKICKQVKAEGNTINEQIAYLVSKGLSPKISQALDLVRVIGNNAVHPGQIDTDKLDIALKLFKLVNRIAYELITHPKEIDEDYKTIIPSSTRKAIEKRNKKAK